MWMSTWLRPWFERRSLQPAPLDPLAGFAQLTVERLEDRRVLSATLASGVNPNVVVNITGNETVAVSVDNTHHLVIADTDPGTADIVIALSDIDSLTFVGDAANQAIVFTGTNPIEVGALHITSGVEDIFFQQRVVANEGGVQVQALHDLTFNPSGELFCTAGDVTLSAGNDLVMSAGSSITADDAGHSWAVSLTAGDDLMTASVHAGLGVTLAAGTTSLDGSLLQINGAIVADAGNVSIIGADDIHFSSGGDVTVTDGSLTVTAGMDVGDRLTMAAGTVFSVSDAVSASVTLTAGGDITVGQILGTNLDLVSVTSSHGVIDLTGSITAQGLVHLDSASGIDDGAAGLLTAANLEILGSGNVVLDNGHSVNTVAAHLVGDLTYHSAIDFVIGTAGGTSGIALTNPGAALELVATIGAITLGGSGADIVTAGGLVSITAGNGFHEGAGSTIVAGQLLLAGTGAFAVDQLNQVDVLAAEIEGTLSFHNAGNLDVGTVNGVQGIQTGSPANGGDVTLIVDGDIRVLETINTQGGSGGAIEVRGGVLNAALVAGAGNITILSNSQDLIINAAQSSATTLTFSARRDVIVNAAIATTGNGADILITADANNDGLGGVQITTAGQVVSADDIVLVGSDLSVTAGSSDSIRIDADGANDQLRAAGDLTLRHQTAAPVTADIVIDGRIHSTSGNINMDARDAILARSSIAADQGSVTFRDAVFLTGDLQVTSAADILFQSTINTAGHNVTINAGMTGNLTVSQAITGGGTVLVQQVHAAEFEAVTVDTLTIQLAATAITFHGPVQVTNSGTVQSRGTILQESTFTAGQNVAFDAAGTITVQAAITAGNQVSLNAGTALTLTETADLSAGAGGVLLTGPQIQTAAEITTNNGDITITGAVTLTGDVTIDTGARGSLYVTGTLDAATAFGQSLFVSTASGDIHVTGNTGSIHALNAIEISNARDVFFGGSVTSNHLLQQAGLGTTTIVGAVNTFDIAGIQLTNQSLQLATRTSSMDSHGHVITLTADAITLPTTFTKAIGSTVTLQTLHSTVSIGLEAASQDLNFTNTQLNTIQTLNLVIGSATQTAGINVGTDSAVSLNENLALLTAGSIGVFGPLTLNGPSNLMLSAGDDIRIQGAVTTAAGSIQLLADDDITIGANGLVTSTSGNVLVRADADGDSNGRGGGITMIDGAQIIVGTGTLALLADESIVLGQLVSSNTTANAITVTSQHGGIVDGGDSRGANIVTTSNSAVVTLSAANGVGSQGGLAADAALETQVNQLAITNSMAGHIGISELDAVTILGVTQNGMGNIVLSSGGTITVAIGGPGVQSHGGEIRLITNGPLSELVLNAEVNSRGGAITLEVGRDLIQAASAPIRTGNGNFAATAGGAVLMLDGALIDSGSGTLTVQAVGNITLSQVRTLNATGNAVLIRSTAGSLIDGGDTLGANIVANSAGAVVTISAAGGIGSLPGAGANAALETQIDGLIASNSIAGDITIAEADALRILSVEQLSPGNINLLSIGDMTVVAGQAGISATVGSVTLSTIAPTANVRIESTVQTNTGSIVINTANDFSMSVAARILSQSGNITVNADADHSLGGTGGSITMADGAKINAGSGIIALNADGNITLGQVITTSMVSLITTSGGIIDGGDLGGANIIATNLAIRAVTGVGSGNALETAVLQLGIRNALSGDIRINNDTGGPLIIGMVNGVVGITNTGASAAAIRVINNGAMLVNADVRNATGGDIFLQAINNGGIDDDLVVNAVIAATNGNGNIELQAGHNLLINDTGRPVDISVVNGGKILGNAEGEVIIGSDVVIQSATGAITGTPPELIHVSTPQITNLGVGTIYMTVQRPFEVGTVIVIDWGDGNIETYVVTEANQQSLAFEHKYLGPPNPLNPAEDIPLKITVLAPGFTTGAHLSPTAGTQLVTTGSYDPNIQFFANGQTVTPASYGALNETVLTSVFKTPGDGLASFPFDLTPEVQYLTFPESPKIDASLLTVSSAPTQGVTTPEVAAQTEELRLDERVVLLEVFSPDGQLQERVVLSEEVLDNLDGVVRGLPDGHYRFVLREAGETQTRLLQEFDVRQGRIAGANDNGDRPPSLMKPKPPMPMVDPPEAKPVDALLPENGDAAANLQHEDELPIVWSGWRSQQQWRKAFSEAALVVAVDGEPAPEMAFSHGARLLRKYGMF